MAVVETCSVKGIISFKDVALVDFKGRFKRKWNLVMQTLKFNQKPSVATEVDNNLVEVLSEEEEIKWEIKGKKTNAFQWLSATSPSKPSLSTAIC